MSAFSKTSLPPVARVGDSADIVPGLRIDTSAARIPARLVPLRRDLPITVAAESLVKLVSVAVRHAVSHLERRPQKRKARQRR